MKVLLEIKLGRDEKVLTSAGFRILRRDRREWRLVSWFLDLLPQHRRHNEILLTVLLLLLSYIIKNNNTYKNPNESDNQNNFN